MTTDPALYPSERLAAVAGAVRANGLDVLLLTPGPDLRYVTGYDAKQLERLTCLAVPADRDPFLLVPRLELKAAQASPAGALDLDIVTWGETEHPFGMIRDAVGDPRSVALSDRMWALHVLQFRDAFPAAKQYLASSVLSALRMRKSAAEIAALKAAGVTLGLPFLDAMVPAGLVLGTRGADAVLEAEGGAVARCPLRTVGRVRDVGHALLHLARRHRREEVGRHPGHVEMAISRDSIIAHWVPFRWSCSI